MKFKLGDKVRVKGTKIKGTVTSRRKDTDYTGTGIRYRVAGKYWNEGTLTKVRKKRGRK